MHKYLSNKKYYIFHVVKKPIYRDIITRLKLITQALGSIKGLSSIQKCKIDTRYKEIIKITKGRTQSRPHDHTVRIRVAMEPSIGKVPFHG